MTERLHAVEAEREAFRAESESRAGTIESLHGRIQRGVDEKAQLSSEVARIRAELKSYQSNAMASLSAHVIAFKDAVNKAVAATGPLSSPYQSQAPAAAPPPGSDAVVGSPGNAGRRHLSGQGSAAALPSQPTSSSSSLASPGRSSMKGGSAGASFTAGRPPSPGGRGGAAAAAGGQGGEAKGRVGGVSPSGTRPGSAAGSGQKVQLVAPGGVSAGKGQGGGMGQGAGAAGRTAASAPRQK